MNEETPLDVLERITPTLSDFSTLNTMNDLTDHFMEHTVEGGTSLMWGLHKEDDVAVAKGLISKGTKFPLHVHNGIHEYVFVLSGCMMFHFPSGGRDRRMLEGDHIHILPDTPHSVTAQKDTWYIAITVPADEAFPHANHQCQ